MTVFDTRPDDLTEPLDALDSTRSPVASPAGALPRVVAGQGFEWPDVDSIPGRPVRSAIARHLFHRAVGNLPLVARFPHGQHWGGGSQHDPTLHLIRPDVFFDRLGASGLIGFGEAYLAGDLDCDSGDELVAALTVLAEHITELVPPSLTRFRRLGIRAQPEHESNTPDGSRRNISRHYDLSNAHFASFLDPTMTYSSALFATAVGTDPGEARWADLEPAQHRKIDRLLDATGVGPGTSVLEIGTGWGELACRAARRGAAVRSITLSTEQRDLAQKRVRREGLTDRVAIDLCDYREVEGSYEAVVSVEMIEAVGAAYWSTYASTLDRVLAPGGTVGLQAITMPHQQMLATVDNYTWIHKYIFPGGMIPSIEALHSAFESTGLRIVDNSPFGLHYAETLRLWRHRYEASHPPETRFDDPVFRRMWRFYLAYCEAGFRARYLDVNQITLRRPR